MSADRYFGDGVYAAFSEERGMIKLYTSNGVEETNVIWLEQEVCKALLQYLRSMLGEVRNA